MSEELLPPAVKEGLFGILGLFLALAGLYFARHPDSARRFVRARFKTGVVYGLSLTSAAIAIGVAFWGFAEVVESWTRHTDLYPLDVRMSRLAEGLASPGRTAFLRAVTRLGDAVFALPLVVLGAFVLYRKQGRWAAAALLVAFGAGQAVVTGFKYLFDRARPEDVLVRVHTAGFPSGHAFTAMVVYGCCIYLLWQLPGRPFWKGAGSLVLAVLIGLIGFSRIYLHAHYFTDVAGGYLLGAAWLIAGLTLTRVLRARSGEAATPRRGEG